MALININYESKTLGMPVMINAIIPQGRGSYKTLYLLHGMGGDYTTWITKSRVADYVDNTDIAVIMISGDNKCTSKKSACRIGKKCRHRFQLCFFFSASKKPSLMSCI